MIERLLHVGRPGAGESWRTREGYVHVRAESVDPARVEHPIPFAGAPPPEERAPAREAELGIAVERMRFAIAVEDDMGDFFRAFKRDPLARGSTTCPGSARSGVPGPGRRSAGRSPSS